MSKADIQKEILQGMGDFLGLTHKEKSAKKKIGTKSKGKTILIFDMMYLFKSIVSASTVTNFDGTPLGGVSGCLNKISYLTGHFQADKVICVFDGSNSHQKRRMLDSNYKMNRGGLAKLSVPFQMSDKDKVDNLKLQQIYLIKILRHMPVYLLQEENQEADDIIAYLTTEYFAENSNNIIVSGDQDFLQLVNKNTKVFFPRSNDERLMNEAMSTEAYGCLPRNIPIMKAIAGDSSDNIAGISGVGTKTVMKYFPELAKKSYTITEFMRLIDSKKEILSKTKTSKKILDGKETILNFYKVTQLHSSNISMNEKNSIIKSLTSPRKGIEYKYNLIDFLKENKLDNVIKLYNLNVIYSKLS